jgi:hypothetical protein
MSNPLEQLLHQLQNANDELKRGIAPGRGAFVPGGVVFSQSKEEAVAREHAKQVRLGQSVRLDDKAIVSEEEIVDKMIRDLFNGLL